MKRATIVTFAILLAISCNAAIAQDTLPAAVQRLSKVGVFAFGGVGFIGKTSQGELDFRIVESQSPEVAAENFEKIFANGDDAAKIYALIGLRQFNKNRSNELFQSLEHSQEKVYTMRGCIMGPQSLADIVKAVHSGSYDSYLWPEPSLHSEDR